MGNEVFRYFRRSYWSYLFWVFMYEIVYVLNVGVCERWVVVGVLYGICRCGGCL